VRALVEQQEKCFLNVILRFKHQKQYAHAEKYTQRSLSGLPSGTMTAPEPVPTTAPIATTTPPPENVMPPFGTTTPPPATTTPPLATLVAGRTEAH
jgi:hypothetical protein